MCAIIRFGSSTLGGATLAVFDLPTAQRLFDKQGKLDQIDVTVRRGYSVTTLLRQIERILPPHTQVRTSEAQAEGVARETSTALAFVRYFLLAFGGIALFVGAFVIANTLSITIAQRTREFATLRSIGATGRQVLSAVVLEGAITGLVAALIGLFLGLALARGLIRVFRAFGAELPQAGLVFAMRTVVVSLIVGVVVVAALALEIRRGTMNGATVAILGVLAASSGLLRLLDLPGGGSGIFFLIVLAGAAFGPRFGMLLGLASMSVSA